MRIDLTDMQAAFLSAQAGKKSRHAPADRTRASIFQYDYLSLRALAADVRGLLGAIESPGGRALDLGADQSPYRVEMEAAGFEVKTLDLAAGAGADYVGTVERTGLHDAAFDLVLCTQVLEHCDAPWEAVREIRRILRPGGHLLVSVPHVWFFHPHPADHWRFTQQGLVRLCQQAGLEVVELRSQGGSLLAAAQVANFLAYGVLGRAGAPLFAAGNVLGLALDRLIENPLFCINFACLARRP